MARSLGPETTCLREVDLENPPNKDKVLSVLPLRNFGTIRWICYLMASLLLCAGCTPKRVVNNEILTGNPPAPDQRRGQTQDQAPVDGTRQLDSPAQQRGGFGARAVDLAKAQLGKMYQWGAEGPDRFDCSGLTFFVYGRLGVNMPRVSSQQARIGSEVPRKSINPGDLLYFNTAGSSINHVGIYVGNSKFIHAPRKGMPVRTDSLNNGWWKQKYRGARRLGS